MKRRYRSGGAAAGGISTSGGFGFGGRATGGGPGAGRTSIGGGNGATCWLTTGALALAPGLALGLTLELGGAAAAGARGALTFGFCGGRRRSRPGIGTSEVG